MGPFIANEVITKSNTDYCFIAPLEIGSVWQETWLVMRDLLVG